jgi:hypothetical protein
MRTTWILALLVGLALPALPQSAAGGPLDKSPYLLRISRATPHLDTCVLLRGDGNYHLERDRDDATEVYEGELSADGLAKVQRWLDNEQLRKLASDQIVTPLVVASVESLQINIFREDHVQDLLFPSVESQGPFHEALAPLLEWFDELHKARHRTIPGDSGKNNCLIPHRIELHTRPEASVQAGKTASSAAGGIAQTQTDVAVPQPATVPSYLMRLEYTRFVQREAERTCAVVYASGRYHLEKSSQEIGGPVKSQVYEASLAASELPGLGQLLENPDLKALQRGNIPEGVKFSFTDSTTVWIPRGEQVQHLQFASDVRVEAAIGGHYVVSDRNLRLMRPLQKWVLTRLPADKVNLVVGATPNLCEPK